MASLGIIGDVTPVTPAQTQAQRLVDETASPVPTHTTPLPLRATRHQRQVIGLIAEGNR